MQANRNRWKHRAATLPLFAIALLLATPDSGAAGRCATGLRGDKPGRFAPLRPALRLGAGRVAAPVSAAAASVHVSEHFRVLWGDGYDHSDSDWGDPDGDGLPTWVAVLAETLEVAYATLGRLGFPEPYGLDRYYLDVYVGNTGVVADGRTVRISSSYYAYTEVHTDYEVAYFIFNDDFSQHTSDELSVLRATAAHELFHAVQRVDYPWDDEVLIPDHLWNWEGWWFEATSTWFEEICQPDVDDYLTYVRDFLAEPEEPLTSMDGLREYGAAIFPGYLWLRHGGAPLWQAVFRNAYAQGLEPAIETALAERREPAFSRVVAAFWSFAGHPEDTWPDGDLFYAANAPKISRSVPGLPLQITTSSYQAPGRYGANLYRFPASQLPAELRISYADPSSIWQAALSVEGSSSGLAVQRFTAGDGEVFFDLEGEGSAYLAVVNVTDEELRKNYEARVETVDRSEIPPDGGAGEDTAGGSGSGGSSGCFLGALARPMTAGRAE